MVVDDDPNVLELINRILSPRGYTLLEAQSGEEALKNAKSFGDSIDLLLTDVILPKMDGRDLAKKFMALYPNAKVLFISGYICPSAAHQESPNSGNAFVKKPFTAKELCSKTRKVLASGYRYDPSAEESSV